MLAYTASQTFDAGPAPVSGLRRYQTFDTAGTVSPVPGLRKSVPGLPRAAALLQREVDAFRDVRFSAVCIL